ncbi:hypothetical protein RBB50_003914 [Rhinocladiella similis]
MDDLTSKPRTGVPGVVYAVINNKGRHIFEHASGNTDVESHSPISLSTTFWLASCTKLIMSIAVMQLVEQGNLSLDDFEQVEEYLPELKELKVLTGDEQLVPKKRGITV